MNNKFDELTQSLAQSVTRRAALKKFGKFGLGLAGVALACFGLANKAEAGKETFGCQTNNDCAPTYVCCKTGWFKKSCVPDKSYCL